MNADPNKYFANGLFVEDPTKVINTIPSGYANTITSNYNPNVYDMNAEIQNLKTTQKLMLLRILHLEGKFDKEEVSNLRKMIMSEDQASRTLAESIIENA